MVHGVVSRCCRLSKKKLLTDPLTARTQMEWGLTGPHNNSILVVIWGWEVFCLRVSIGEKDLLVLVLVCQASAIDGIAFHPVTVGDNGMPLIWDGCFLQTLARAAGLCGAHSNLGTSSSVCAAQLQPRDSNQKCRSC